MDKNIRRENIITSAIKVFSEKNYNTATTADVAKEAGVAEGTLYYHFESKKDLFLECTRYIENLLLQHYKAIYKENEDQPLEFLRRVALLYTNFIYDNPAMSKFLTYLLSNTFVQEIYEDLQHFVTINTSTTFKMIEKAKGMKKLDGKIDSKALAWFFVGGYFTIVLMQELNVSKEECLSIVENQFNNYFST